MSKIKDQIEIEKRLADKELEASEPKDYAFNEELHLHSFQGKPLCGTSTVLNVLAKPLTWWASGLAVAKLGWTNSKIKIDGNYTNIDLETRLKALQPQYEAIKAMSSEQFLGLLDEAYKAHSTNLKSTAQAGTDLHAELERYVKNWMLCHDPKNKGGDMLDETIYDDRIIPFITWADENIEKFLWSELYCFSETLWLGGISDVGVLLKNGKVGILDFKSSKESYDNQFIQNAGYDLQITENGGYTKEGNKIFQLDTPISFYGIVPFGAKEFTVDFRYNVEELREGFKSALVLYKLLNK